jgi:DNA-binding response OmpR family regulator
MKSTAPGETGQDSQDSSELAIVATASAFPTLLLRLGGIECDLWHRRVWREGRQLRVAPREFDLLSFLMLNIGRVFSREQLLGAVWDAAEVDVRTVDVTIGGLRKAINRNFYPDPICSVRGRGYKFHEDFAKTHARWAATRRKKRRLAGA